MCGCENVQMVAFAGYVRKLLEYPYLHIYTFSYLHINSM